MRERGLKCENQRTLQKSQIVAPLAGAWIEMGMTVVNERQRTVAPLAGAWIEIIYVTEGIYDGSGRSPCGSVD